MNRTITITIRDKIARADRTVYICGNSDFVAHFDFDDDWAEHDAKTARFISGDGKYQDVVFRGTDCPVPVISDTYMIKVGVFAGDLHTTTSAIVSAKKSILCEAGVPADPAPDVYSQIMEQINAGMLRGEQGEQGIPGPAGPAGAPGKDAEPYTLPVASAETLGGVKVGAGLQMDGDALGIMKEEWVRLEWVQIPEDSLAFTRTKEPNGKDYDLSAMKVIIKTPPGQQSGSFIFNTYDVGGQKISYSATTCHANTYPEGSNHRSSAFFNQSPLAGLYNTFAGSGTQGSLMQINYPPNADHQTISTSKKIAKFEMNIYNNIVFKAGTTIEIWGVRADA